MKKILIAAAVVLGLLGSASARAQQVVRISAPLPPFGAIPAFLMSAPIKGGNASLSVSTGSGSVALTVSSATYPALLLTNDGAVELSYELGASAATTNAKLPAGNSVCFSANGATNVAAITVSGTTTLTVTQFTACPVIGGGGSGGSSSVTITGTLPAFAATPTFNIGTAPTIAVTGTFWQATQPVSLATLPAFASTPTFNIGTGSVGISGTLPGFTSTPTFNIGTAPTIAVTGTFFQATQPVSLTTLPAFASTPTVNVGTMPTVAVTGTFWQTTQPVSLATLPAFAATPAFNLSQVGGASVALGKAAETASLPVVLANDLRPSSGNITVLDSASTATVGMNSAPIIAGSPTASSSVANAVNGLSLARFQISGTWTGTLSFEQSVDGGTTYGILGCHGNGTIYSLSSSTGNGIFDCEASGATHVRVRATSAMTGTATITTTLSIHPGILKILNSVAIKDNVSGKSLAIDTAGNAGTYTPDLANVALGGTTEGAWTGSGPASVNSAVKGVYSQVGATQATVGAALPGKGQLFIASDGGSACGGPCAIVPQVLTAGLAGAPSKDTLTFQGPGIPFTVKSDGTTGVVSATLPVVSGKQNFICGFDVSAIGGTAAVSPITVAGLSTSFIYEGVFSAAGGVNFGKKYDFGGLCLPASGSSVAITVTTTAAAGATAVHVNAWGYYQ